MFKNSRPALGEFRKPGLSRAPFLSSIAYFGLVPETHWWRSGLKTPRREWVDALLFSFGWHDRIMEVWQGKGRQWDNHVQEEIGES